MNNRITIAEYYALPANERPAVQYITKRNEVRRVVNAAISSHPGHYEMYFADGHDWTVEATRELQVVTPPATQPDMNAMLARIDAADDESRTAISLAIVAIADAYLEAVDPSELDELIQLQADKEAAQQEIIEVIEAQSRYDALANKGQLTAIATLIARHAPHRKPDWFHRFTRSLFEFGIEMNHLTTAQVSQVEIDLARIARNRAYGSEWSDAILALDIHYKFDLYPDDLARAKKSYEACVQQFAYEVSLGRTNHPKHLTHYEAEEFSKLVNIALSVIA